MKRERRPTSALRLHRRAEGNCEEKKGTVLLGDEFAEGGRKRKKTSATYFNQGRRSQKEGLPPPPAKRKKEGEVVFHHFVKRGALGGEGRKPLSSLRKTTKGE